jgi:hypothetical protein
MTNPNRPGPPYTAPRGHRWVPDVVEQADPVEVITGGGDRKCSARRSPDLTRVNPCNAVARAIVAGKFLCAYHLGSDGLWVDAGVVMRWVLEPTAEEESA